MIYTTKELLNKGETEYSIRNKVASGSLYVVARGVYSDELDSYIDELYYATRYPNAIITGISAFYIYELTDNIPDKIHVASEQHSYPIRNTNIVQSYQEASFFEIGKTRIAYNDGYINIYDQERLLIELIRLKEKYPKDLYYEVLDSFRKIKHKIDFYKINKYVKHFKNGDALLQKIKELI